MQPRYSRDTAERQPRDHPRSLPPLAPLRSQLGRLCAARRAAELRLTLLRAALVREALARRCPVPLAHRRKVLLHPGAGAAVGKRRRNLRPSPVVPDEPLQLLLLLRAPRRPRPPHCALGAALHVARRRRGVHARCAHRGLPHAAAGFAVRAAGLVALPIGLRLGRLGGLGGLCPVGDQRGAAWLLVGGGLEVRHGPLALPHGALQGRGELRVGPRRRDRRSPHRVAPLRRYTDVSLLWLATDAAPVVAAGRRRRRWLGGRPPAPRLQPPCLELGCVVVLSRLAAASRDADARLGVALGEGSDGRGTPQAAEAPARLAIVNVALRCQTWPLANGTAAARSTAAGRTAAGRTAAGRTAAGRCTASAHAASARHTAAAAAAANPAAPPASLGSITTLPAAAWTLKLRGAAGHPGRHRLHHPRLRHPAGCAGVRHRRPHRRVESAQEHLPSVHPFQRFEAASLALAHPLVAAAAAA